MLGSGDLLPVSTGNWVSTRAEKSVPGLNEITVSSMVKGCLYSTPVVANLVYCSRLFVMTKSFKKFAITVLYRKSPRLPTLFFKKFWIRWLCKLPSIKEERKCLCTYFLFLFIFKTSVFGSRTENQIAFSDHSGVPSPRWGYFCGRWKLTLPHLVLRLHLSSARSPGHPFWAG